MRKLFVLLLALVFVATGYTNADLSVTGVFVYDSGFATPTGFLRVVDDTSNPQYMVFMGKDNIDPGIDLTGMQSYVPPTGTAIPTNALRELLISSNGTTTRVHDGADGFLDAGNWSNWVVDPQDDGSDYLLFTAAGLATNDSDNSSKHFIPWTRSIGSTAKIRLVYITGWTAPITFAGGNGSSGDPYQIDDCDAWQLINNNLTGYFVLTQNLDCRSIGNDVIIGSPVEPFAGSLDGSGYTIAYSINTGDSNIGLFGVIDGGSVSNLGLSGSVVSTDHIIGGLAGYIQSGQDIENIFGTVYVSGLDQVGGLFGVVADDQILSGISLSGTILAGGAGGFSYAGGIIGEGFINNTIDINNSSFVGTVSGEGQYVGGLAGLHPGGSIENSSFSGTAVGERQIGGLIGISYSGTILSSYANTYLSGLSAIGGLIGNSLGSDIFGSHAIVDIHVSSQSAGGLVGSLDGEIHNSYASGTISGSSAMWLGGIGGYVDSNSLIRRSYTSVDIGGDSSIGGLAGYVSSNTTISDSYTFGDIYPTDNNATAGGAIGVALSITVENLLSVGNISLSGNDIGGLIGANYGANVYDSFWDIQTSGIETSDGGSGLQTSQLQAISTFADAGWSIGTSEGDLNNGYPYFLWQENPDLSGNVWVITPRADLLVYMNRINPSVTGRTYHYDIQFANGLTPLNNVVVTLYGDIPDGSAVTVASGTTATSNILSGDLSIRDSVSGSYIQWSGIALDASTGADIRVAITHPSDGTYTLTASIASMEYDLTSDSNSVFVLNSTIDTVTDAPTITLPTSGGIYTGTIPFDIEIAEVATSSSIQLTFVPDDNSLDTVVLGLNDFGPGVSQTFMLDPTNPTDPTIIANASTGNIVDGLYNVVLSYQDNLGNPAAGSNVVRIHVGEAPNFEPENGNNNEGGGGGGGGSSRSRDYCPNGDFTNSYYDNNCGINNQSIRENRSTNEDTSTINTTKLDCSYDEYNIAYGFSYKHHITTMGSCSTANMDEYIIRKHAAKMISNYAINVLGKNPDTTKKCLFDDMGAESDEMKLYAIAACQLGLMGLNTDGSNNKSFNPNEYLNKAQLATILSRALYDNKYNGNTDCRYCDHVDALYDAGIITITSDLFDPLPRAFAMIMLMRSSK